MSYKGGWVHPKAVCWCNSFSTPIHFFCPNTQSLSYPDKQLMLHLLTLINSLPPAFYFKRVKGEISHSSKEKKYRFNRIGSWFSLVQMSKEKHMLAHWRDRWTITVATTFTSCHHVNPHPHSQPFPIFKFSILISCSYMQWITKSCNGREGPTLDT